MPHRHAHVKKDPCSCENCQPDGPRSRVCPACNAQPGKPCTQPTSTTRIPVRWYHYKRSDT